MSIPQTKYVAITSGIADTQAAAYKDLILRVFTTNDKFGIGTVYEFSGSNIAADVSDFAGATTIEAKIASEYAGWVSKRANKAQKISFMRYSFEAVAPYIYATQTAALATLKAVTSGSMIINLGGTSYTLTGLNFSSATSYADIATVLQTAVRANTSGGALWTSATVAYDADKLFKLTGGTTGANEIGYATAAASGTDISGLIGWSLSSQAVLSQGQAAQTITDILNQSVNLTNNFLTFGFVSASDAYSNLDNIGAWVQAQNFNYRFCFEFSFFGKNNFRGRK